MSTTSNSNTPSSYLNSLQNKLEETRQKSPNMNEFREDVLFYKQKFKNGFKKISKKYDYFYKPYRT